MDCWGTLIVTNILNLGAEQDFCSNILGGTKDFCSNLCIVICSNILGTKQDFSSHILVQSKTLFKQFGCKATLLFKHLAKMFEQKSKQRFEQKSFLHLKCLNKVLLCTQNV
jgi:hypothetical protein